MIAKNYLEEKQIKRLERAVNGYFDYIEDLIERENTFTMEEFSKSVNEFLEFRKYDILKDNGKISRKKAEEKAEKEYNEFNKIQKITSDFDKLLEDTKRIKKDQQQGDDYDGIIENYEGKIRPIIFNGQLINYDSFREKVNGIEYMGRDKQMKNTIS